MTKYKQGIIPSVKTKVIGNDRKSVSKYYSENLQGKTVVNKDLKISIKFNAIGKGEISYGRSIHSKKVAVLQCLEVLLSEAEYNNFGIRKASDDLSVLGYLNFKAKVRIDGKLEYVRLTVLMKKDGKIYYHHEINMKKQPNTQSL
ncbi:MAG TPA: hypothetical protein VK152_11675 [Paludibacter sp.]|nr:hypothetical protein [Paludibacter sp.]